MVSSSNSNESNGSTTTSSAPSLPSQSSPSPKDKTPRGLSGGTKAGIAVGVVFAVVIVCTILYLLFRRRRHQRQIPSTLADGSVDVKPGATESQIAELRGETNSDQIKSFSSSSRSEKHAPGHSFKGVPILMQEVSADEKPLELSDKSIASAETPELSNTVSLKKQKKTSSLSKVYSPYRPPQELDTSSNNHGHEIDSNPIFEAPKSPAPPTSATDEDADHQSSLRSLIDRGRSYTHADELIRLEEEQRELDAEIARAERLENLKARRDGVRRKIVDLSQRSRLDSSSQSMRSTEQ